MGTDLLERLTAIRDRCKKELPELEFWPGYYDRRLSEFKTYLPLFPKKTLGAVLEVGCGNGFYSALLAAFSEQVIATDLEDPEVPLHAKGLSKAKKLVAHLGIPNVALQPASVEKLPFADESFDFIFSSHVMGYVRNPEAAVSELARVLRPGGHHFCIVPTRMNSAYQLFFFQVYIAERAAHKLLLEPLRKLRVPRETEPLAAAPGPIPVAKKKSMLKDYPFPPSFGGLPRWVDEFKTWSPDGWKKILISDERFSLISQSTTQLNPLIPILGNIRPGWASWVHDATRGLELRLGAGRLAKNFGSNAVIVTQKRSP